MFVCACAAVGSDGFEAPQAYMDKCTQIGVASGTLYEVDGQQGYCALLVMLDENVGRTVCALETAGLMINTLVVFASDNGGSLFICCTPPELYFFS